METGKTNTAEFKREAIRLLEASGKSITRIERALGIGSSTLARSCSAALGGPAVSMYSMYA